MTARDDNITSIIEDAVGRSGPSWDAFEEATAEILAYLDRAGWVPPRAGENTTAPEVEHMSMMECGARGHRWTEQGYCRSCDAAVWPNARAESPAQHTPDPCMACQSPAPNERAPMTSDRPHSFDPLTGHMRAPDRIPRVFRTHPFPPPIWDEPSRAETIAAVAADLQTDLDRIPGESPAQPGDQPCDSRLTCPHGWANCPPNAAGDVRCPNDGERVNVKCWKCGTPRHTPKRPVTPGS